MSSGAFSARRAVGALLIVAGLALAIYQVWWSKRPTDGIPRHRRPVVLITLDTLRADHLAPYGADFETPFFSSFAEQAVLFERAFSVAPITLVAHTSMMTGLYPPQHGVRNNGMHSAASSLDTLAERLRRRGWRTGAFVSAAVLEDRYGLDQGFEVYDDDLSTSVDRQPHTVPDRPAAATIDSALSWLDALPDGERFLLWVHLYDPHAPYAAPKAFRRAHPDRPYVAEVTYLDSELERLMAHPKLALSEGGDAPLVALIGDHGESLGEHGEQTHALLAYDGTLRVPFMLKIPGGPVGKKVQEPVGQVDLMPTLLDALGLSRTAVGDRSFGRSLLPAMAGRKLPNAGLYAETYLPHYTYGWAKLKAYRFGDFKWIDAPSQELYELSKDPFELTNVIDSQPGLAHDLARNLAELEAGFGDPEFEHAQTLDSESREKLRSLGYLSIADASVQDGESLADPKEMVGIHVALEKARHLRGDRFFDLAEIQLREALAKDPRNLAILGELADNQIQQGRLEQAAALLEQALELAPTSAVFYLRLAALEGVRNEPEKALGLVDAALSSTPDMIEAQIEKASILQRLGRRDEARALLSQSLRNHPDHARLLMAHAMGVELSNGDPAGAEARLRRAVELDPFLASAWNRLGEILEAGQRFEDAESAYRSGIERQPTDFQLNLRLGLLLARRGAEDAEGPLREALRLTTHARSDLFMALGSWLQGRGRVEEAERLYAQWVDLEVDSPLVRNNQAIAYFGLGRFAEARTILEALVEAYPGHVDALSNLASVAAEQKDWASAQRHAREVLERRPELVDPWNTLGLALTGLGRLDEAIKALEKALDLDPSYWQARLNLGDAFLLRGDASGAERQYLQVVDTSPSLKQVRRKLAELYGQGGALADPEKVRPYLLDEEATKAGS